MNLIECLKKADGKLVRRMSWGEKYPLADIYDEIGVNANDCLADDWYVVVEKSKIEDAIEAASQPGGRYSGLTMEQRMRTIVNLTLDEAIAVERKVRREGASYEHFLKQLEALKVTL